ncbi:MAG: long-chain fatty acid--CoA ligase [Chloroflexaceae bacterium]|jgi:fatty-acyl-CoA synthase|nr:long-chain fatty acid--CoA ligase [Chloroflexaceae bacterium]
MQGLMMDYQLTVDRILEHANRFFAHKQVITKQPDGSIHRYTYGDMYRRVKRMAKALVQLGVQPGDRIGTFSWNNYQHLELYYAIPGAGAVCHTLNIRLHPDQLAYIINHAEDKLIFVDGTLLPALERLADQLPTVEHVVVFNAPREVQSKLPGLLHYEDLVAQSDEDFTWRCTDERQASVLCYTSGTTGNPKGVLYDHRALFLHAYGECQANALGLCELDTVLPVVPQFHVMAWGLPFGCPMAGANMVMPGPHLNPAALAQLIEDERVTVAAGVPSIWNGLYQELRSKPRDISCIRALVVGGSAMPRGLIEAYERDLHVNVMHAWGMTEMSPLGTVSIPHTQHQQLSQQEIWDIKALQGYALAGVELRIVNDAGEELPWDGTTMGELQVRGPWITKGYYKVEPAPESFTADGWFRTGDVATITGDGYMCITDRTKDLIKSGGEWISSVALENKLMAHPKVVEAAVIAIPNQQWGERPLAAVVLAPNASANEEELIGYLAESFAKFELPDKIVFVAEVPKTSVGKFDKKVVRQRFAEGQLL